MKTSVTAPIAMPVRLDGYALPPRFSLVITEDDSGAPDLTLHFRVVDLRVECCGMELKSQDGGGREVVVRDLRAVRLGDLMDLAVEWSALPIEEEGVGSISLGQRKPGDRGAVRAVTRRRRTVNPTTLRKVAAIALTSERPVDEVMELLAVERRAAQLWIKRARENVDPDTSRPYLATEGD